MPAPSDLVFRFANLSSPSEIVNFCKRFGVLRDAPHTPRQRTVREPLRAWTVTIGAVQGLLNLDAMTKAGQCATREHFEAFDRWKYFLGGLEYPTPDRRQLSGYDRKIFRHLSDAEFVEHQRWWLLNSINTLLAESRVIPYADFSDNRVQVGFRSQDSLMHDEISLLGVLGTQLTCVAASAKAIDTCAECGNVFLAERKRASSRRAFCGTCGRPAALRHAKLDLRRRRTVH